MPTNQDDENNRDPNRAPGRDPADDGSTGGAIRWTPDENVARAAAQAAQSAAPMSWDTAFNAPGAAPPQGQNQNPNQNQNQNPNPNPNQNQNLNPNPNQAPPANQNLDGNPFFNNYQQDPTRSSTLVPALPKEAEARPIDYSQPTGWSPAAPPNNPSNFANPAGMPGAGGNVNPSFKAPTPFAAPPQAPAQAPAQAAPQGFQQAPPAQSNQSRQNMPPLPVSQPQAGNPQNMPHPMPQQQQQQQPPQQQPAPQAAPMQQQQPTAQALGYNRPPQVSTGTGVDHSVVGSGHGAAPAVMREYYTSADIAEEIRREQMGLPKVPPRSVAPPGTYDTKPEAAAGRPASGPTASNAAGAHLADNPFAQGAQGAQGAPGDPGASGAPGASPRHTYSNLKPDFVPPDMQAPAGDEVDMSAIPEIENGRIWENRTSREILMGILKSKKAEYAVALFASTDGAVQGEMLIVKSVVIHGAKLVDPDISGYEALKIMLAIPHGTYTLLDVTNYTEQAKQLEQGLNVRLTPLTNALPNLPDSMDDLMGPSNISKIRSQGPVDIDAQAEPIQRPKQQLSLSERLPPPKILILSAVTVIALITMLVVLFNR